MKKILLLSVLCSTFVFADSPRSVDPLTFDVAGVRLGMGREEAIKALAASQEVDISAIELERYPSKNIITGEKEAQQFQLKNDKVTISVKLKPDPAQNGQLVVSLVQYNIPYTEDNAKALEEAVLAKYGKPTSDKLGGWRYCKEIDPKDKIIICKDVYNVPQLILNGTFLKLEDPRVGNALEAWIKEQKAVKPKI